MQINEENTCASTVKAFNISCFHYTFSAAIRCSEPEEIPNGDVDRKCQTFGCRISYKCRAGYELDGRQHRYCQADGSWSPRILPECVRKYRHQPFR